MKLALTIPSGYELNTGESVECHAAAPGDFVVKIELSPLADRSHSAQPICKDAAETGRATTG